MATITAKEDHLELNDHNIATLPTVQTSSATHTITLMTTATSLNITIIIATAEMSPTTDNNINTYASGNN